MIDYSYDGLYRLTKAVYRQNNSLAATRSYSYAYDQRGNITSSTAFVAANGTDPATTVQTSFNYNPSLYANQIQNTSTTTNGGAPVVRNFAYDSRQNMTSDGQNTYTYDLENRLTGFSNSSLTASYGYDGFGNRVSQTNNGQTTNYLLDRNTSLTQVLAEIGAAPGASDDTWYLLGLDVIGQQQDATWSYFNTDGLGSVRQVMNAAGNQVTYGVSFDPYGNPINNVGTRNTNLGFTGEFTDPSGMTFLRARYLNNNLGVFTSLDPVMGVIGGANIHWNGYSYALANPTNFTDPSGEFVGIITIALGVAVVGAAAASFVGILYVLNQATHPGQSNLGQDLAQVCQQIGGVLGGLGSLSLQLGTLGASTSQSAYNLITEFAKKKQISKKIPKDIQEQMDDYDGYQTPSKNTAQNKEFDEAVKTAEEKIKSELGGQDLPVDDDVQREVHDLISKEGVSKEQIVDEILYRVRNSRMYRHLRNLIDSNQ